MMVDINNVSHVIKKMYWDPQDPRLLLGEVETAGTTTGKNMAGLIRENGMEASFSMRGLGDVTKSNGTVTVKDPLRIVTYDLVHFPSHQKAYQRNLMESKQIPVSVNELAKYAADNSKDFAMLNESVLCIAKEYLEFQLDESGNLLVNDKATGKPRVKMMVEQELAREVKDIYSRVMKF